MDGSPIRLRRCLGGRFGIMCPALGPVERKKITRPGVRPEALGMDVEASLCPQESSRDRTVYRSPDQVPCPVDTARELLMLEWPEARAAAGRMRWNTEEEHRGRK